MRGTVARRLRKQAAATAGPLLRKSYYKVLKRDHKRSNKSQYGFNK